jgi:hypothetical protein
MFMMQLFQPLARTKIPQLIPLMLATACLWGPELNALPGVPAALWEREQQRRDREVTARAARGDGGQMLPEEKWREQVNDKWREQVLAAVADLKVAQVGRSLVVLLLVWMVVGTRALESAQPFTTVVVGSGGVRCHVSQEGRL